MKAFGFIYETVNNINGKKYIGKCIYSRINNWESYLGSGTYLKRAIKRYGKANFTRKILAEAYDEKELNDLEEYFIKKYNAVMSNEYYNLKFTSIGGDIFSTNPRKESIRKMRIQQMSGTSNHQYGKTKSEKMINSVRKSNSKPILIDEIKYQSLTEASQKLNINLTTISYRLDSKHYPNYIRLIEKNVCNKVSCNKEYPIEIDGVIFKSIKNAVQQLNLPKSTIRSRLNSKNFPTYKKLK